MRWDGVDDRWPTRLEAVARHIRPEESVLDLGAGAEGLRRLLGPDRDYTPADLPEFDMDRGLWPEGWWDVAVMAGVLEYAHDPGDALARMRAVARRALVTYAHGGARRDPDWNDLTWEQLTRLAAGAGWRARFLGTWRAPGLRAQRIWELS